MTVRLQCGTCHHVHRRSQHCEHLDFFYKLNRKVVDNLRIEQKGSAIFFTRFYKPRNRDVWGDTLMAMLLESFLSYQTWNTSWIFEMIMVISLRWHFHCQVLLFNPPTREGWSCNRALKSCSQDTSADRPLGWCSCTPFAKIFMWYMGPIIRSSLIKIYMN